MMAENLTIIDDEGPDDGAGYDGASAPLARAERDRLDAFDPDRAHQRARDAWLAAEKKAAEAHRERSKQGAEFVHNLICECGCNPIPIDPEGGCVMARFLRALARFEDSWFGDLLGAVSIFGILIGLLMIGAAMGWN